MWEQFIFFLKEEYFLISYGITLAASLVYYRRYFDTCLKYFPILITYTFLNEFLGYLVKNHPKFHLYIDVNLSSYNEILYNIYAVISFAFFYYIYWKLVKNKKFKRWIVIGSLVVAVAYILSLFFQDPKQINLFYATAVGSWVLVFCIALYFFDKLRQKEKLLQPLNLMYWVSIALLLFYMALPVLFLIGYSDIETWENYGLKTVLRILIVIMYGLLTIGFFKGRKRAFG